MHAAHKIMQPQALKTHGWLDFYVREDAPRAAECNAFFLFEQTCRQQTLRTCSDPKAPSNAPLTDAVPTIPSDPSSSSPFSIGMLQRNGTCSGRGAVGGEWLPLHRELPGGSGELARRPVPGAPPIFARARAASAHTIRRFSYGLVPLLSQHFRVWRR